MQTSTLSRDRAYVRILRATNSLDETIQADGLSTTPVLTPDEQELLVSAVRVLRRVESQIEAGF